jgi:hypothetical protein
VSVEIDAYAAGVFDGEGCVGFYIRKSTGTALTFLSVTNVDDNLLDFWVVNFGGRVRYTVKDDTFTLGVWEVYGVDADKMACRILPYSIVKREQLELFLEGRLVGKGKGAHLSEDDKILLDEYAFVIKDRKRSPHREL